MIKYEKEILAAFDMLGKKPRGRQLAQIDEVVVSFVDEKYDNVILNASTGAGKSIIGAVVAEVLQNISPFTLEEGGPPTQASFILMGTNVLTQQYADTFAGNNKFLLVKGSSNYPCDLLSTPVEPKFGDDCCRTDLLRTQNTELIDLVSQFCSSCELYQNRQRRLNIRHLITNYSFYFIDRMLVEKFPPRTITVWDEAHTVNDVFSEHNAIYCDDKRLEIAAEEIAKELNYPHVDLFNNIKLLREAIKKKTINETNYIELLDVLMCEVYQKAELHATKMLENISMKTDMPKYTKIKRISKKYHDLACKIDDLFKYEYEHVFELDKDKPAFSVKPIFVDKMFEVLLNSKYQLFMSATVSKTLLQKTLGLDPNTTKFIKLEPTFPKENKKIIFHGIEKLNYEQMKKKEIIQKLCDVSSKIVERHIDEGESGIILTPSFVVTQEIAKNVKSGKVIEHLRGQKLADYVRLFKQSKVPSVLISPSLWEGISLDGDESRFQIFVKAPFASLGDKRTQYISVHHKELYTLGTILKLVQGAGRSVRSEDDYATTYMLDQMINMVWQNQMNVWSDEFEVSFQRFV